jgi:hypothetical protein
VAVSQVSQRKCKEHDDCQLVSRDGGDWEHYSTKRLRAGFKESSREEAARKHLEAVAASGDRIIGSLTKTGTKAAETLARLEETVERYAQEWDAVVGIAEKWPQAVELSNTLRDRLKLQEAQIAFFEARKDDFTRVLAIHQELMNLAAELRSKLEGVLSFDRETRRLVEVERDNRIAGYEKVQRQIRDLAKQISEG